MRRVSLLLACSALACVPEFDDDLSTIREPRLLAVQATPAEVKPRAGVTLRALVAGPEGVPHEEPQFALCLARKPLSELGPISPECLSITGDVVQDLGRGFEVDASIPDDVCRRFGPSVPLPQKGEPPARPVDPDTTGGFYQPVMALFGEKFSLGTVRLDCGVQASTENLLAYNSQYRPNENPRIAALRRTEDGAALEPGEAVAATVAPGSSLSLEASWDECPTESVCGDGICGAREDRANCATDCALERPRGCTGAEPYVWYDLDSFKVEPRREGIRVAWYASAGSFADEQTGRVESDRTTSTSNVWRAPSTRGVHRLWLVIRDSRGGVSWETYRVEVER